MIDYYVKGLSRGLSPSLSLEYEKICLKRDKAIEEYNKAIREGNENLKQEQADIILKCQFKAQELLLGRGC